MASAQRLASKIEAPASARGLLDFRMVLPNEWGRELKLLLCLALSHYVPEYPDVMGELGDIVV